MICYELTRYNRVILMSIPLQSWSRNKKCIPHENEHFDDTLSCACLDGFSWPDRWNLDPPQCYSTMKIVSHRIWKPKAAQTIRSNTYPDVRCKCPWFSWTCCPLGSAAAPQILLEASTVSWQIETCISFQLVCLPKMMDLKLLMSCEFERKIMF